MNLASLAPGPNRSEKRTFQCPQCDLLDIKIVADPLASDAVHRLTDNIRPPA
jgi:hypothetical protein